MPWYSILPPQLIYLESWAAKVFVRPPSSISPATFLPTDATQFALGLVTIIPWAVLLAFDLVLYISRMSLYELPALGGGGDGRRRARAVRRDGAGAGAGSGAGAGDPGNNDGVGEEVMDEKSRSQTQPTVQDQDQEQDQTTGLR
jgi:hypothetical protein